MKRKLLISAAVIALVLACFGLGVIPVNLFFVKTAISEAAREQLGAELNIEGPLRLRLGFNPSLTASAISLSVPGSAGQPLAVIEKLTIRPRLLKIIHGDLFLRSVEASGIMFDYCPQRLPEPKAETVDSAPEGRQWPAVAVTRLSLREIRLQCLQPGRALDLLPEMLELRASAPLNKPFGLEVSGRGADAKMELSVSAGSLNELLSDPEEYPLALQFNTLSTELRLDGSISRPLRNAEIQARLEIGVENVSDTLANFELDVPGLDALSVHSEIWASGEEFRLDGLESTLNEIPFRLSGMARNFTSRPWLEINAELEQLDLARLVGEGNQSTSDEENTFVDFQPLFDGLSRLDGRASLHIGRILNAPFALEKLAIEASLDHGRLSLDHAGLMLAGSEVTAQAALDTGLDCARLETQLMLSGFDLGNLNPLLETDSDVGGRLDQIRLTTGSCGVSLDEHVSSMQASVAMAGLKPLLGNQDPHLELSRLEADLNWSEPGELFFDGELLGENLSAAIGFGSVETIRAGTRSPLNISVNGDSFRASMNGDGAIRDDKLELDVVLAVDVSRMGSLHAWLGTAPESRLSFKGRTGLRLDDAGLSINDLVATLGSSDLRGTLTWAGPVSDLPMTANLKSSRLDLGEIAGLFPGSAAPEQKPERKWLELLDEGDWIERWFSLPAINVDFAVTRLDGVLAQASNAKLQANLMDRLIDQGRLSFQFEGIDVVGTLDADLREQPWAIDFETALSNLDIGRLLSALDLAENVDAQAKSASISYVSEGNSLGELASNSRLESRIEMLHWAFKAGPEQRQFDIKLSELELIAAPSSKTTWQTSGKLNGSPVKAWMRTPSLPATFDPALDLPLTLAVGTGNGVTMLDMTIQRVTEDELRTDFVISGEFTDPGSVDFASLVSPLGDYELRTQLTVDETGYLISNLAARIGTSKATGTIDIREEGPGYRFDLDLNSPFLETDNLVQWAADFRNARQLISAEKVNDTARQDVNAGMLTLADQYIDEFSGQNILNLHAAVDELRSSGKLLGKAQLELKIDEDEFLLDPVKIELPGGNVDARYSGNHIDGGYEYALKLDIERLEYGGLLRLFDPESEARGEIFLDVSLQSRSPDAAHAVNHLQGHVDLAMIPEDVEAGFLDLWASNLIFALLPSGESSGKKLNCMVARFEVEAGVMKSKNTFLDSTDTIVRVRGDIDLANRQLDLLVAPQAKREKFLSVSTPIAVTGPFNDFQVGVAPGGFLATMFRWYYGLVYVPWKWLTGVRFSPDGIATCYSAMDWEVP